MVQIASFLQARLGSWRAAAVASPRPPTHPTTALPQQPCPVGVSPFTEALSEKRVAERAL